jgi:hypothetical protein
MGIAEAFRRKFRLIFRFQPITIDTASIFAVGLLEFTLWLLRAQRIAAAVRARRAAESRILAEPSELCQRSAFIWQQSLDAGVV